MNKRPIFQAERKYIIYTINDCCNINSIKTWQILSIPFINFFNQFWWIWCLWDKRCWITLIPKKQILPTYQIPFVNNCYQYPPTLCFVIYCDECICNLAVLNKSFFKLSKNFCKMCTCVQYNPPHFVFNFCSKFLVLCTRKYGK